MPRDRPMANMAEVFYHKCFEMHEHKIGIVMVGVSSMDTRGEGWGPGVRLGNNEVAYSRQAINRVGDVVVTRLATRIECETQTDDYPARVALAVLIEREFEKSSDSMAVVRPPVPRQQTIGAKMVHLLPLEFHSHQVSSTKDYQPGRLYSKSNLQCVLGSALTIIGSGGPVSTPDGGVRHVSALNSSVGYAVPVLAARILGSDSVEDATPYKPVENVTYAAWLGECVSRADALARDKTASATHHAFTDAERVLEMLSPYFLLQMLTSRFATGALPDMVHSPLGVPLLIAMAVSVAVNWRRYGLSTPSDTDRMACEYLREELVAHWSPLSVLSVERFLAIDCALKSGYTEALARTKKSVKLRDRMIGNLTLLQRIGQRVVTECYAQRPQPPVDNSTGKPLELPSLLSDPFARVTATYAEACNAEVVAVSHSVNTMGHMEVVESLLSHFNMVELWFRTGRYHDRQLSPKNEEVKDTPAPAGAAEDDVYRMVNLVAVHRGGEVFMSWCLDGPICCFELLCMQTILVAPHEYAPCCWCGAAVHALPSCMMRVGGSECNKCGRRRCFMCAAMIVKARDGSFDPCTYCGTCEGRRQDDITDDPGPGQDPDESAHNKRKAQRLVQPESDNESTDSEDDRLLVDLLMKHNTDGGGVRSALVNGDGEIPVELLNDVAEEFQRLSTR